MTLVVPRHEIDLTPHVPVCPGPVFSGDVLDAAPPPPQPTAVPEPGTPAWVELVGGLPIGDPRRQELLTHGIYALVGDLLSRHGDDPSRVFEITGGTVPRILDDLVAPEINMHPFNPNPDRAQSPLERATRGVIVGTRERQVVLRTQAELAAQQAEFDTHRADTLADLHEAGGKIRSDLKISAVGSPEWDGLVAQLAANTANIDAVNNWVRPGTQPRPHAEPMAAGGATSAFTEQTQVVPAYKSPDAETPPDAGPAEAEPATLDDAYKILANALAGITSPTERKKAATEIEKLVAALKLRSSPASFAVLGSVLDGLGKAS